MISNFKTIYDVISRKKPVPLAVVQPKSRFINEALQEAESRGWIIPQPFEHRDDSVAAQLALESIESGTSSLLMKGDIPSPVLLKAVLETGKNTAQTRLSHVAVVESPHYPKLMLWSDGGVNIQLDKEIMPWIISNAISFARSLQNYRPNIAMLSLVEKINPKLPETVLASEMAQLFKENQSCAIEGPVALDVALSETAAKRKGIDSKISGRTDIFIGSSITTTNHIVKSLMSIGGARGGGIILGGYVPIVLLSRSDSTETKLNSIALGLLTQSGEQ